MTITPETPETPMTAPLSAEQLARARHLVQRSIDECEQLGRQDGGEVLRVFDHLTAELARVRVERDTERAASLANAAELVRADTLIGELRAERDVLAKALIESNYEHVWNLDALELAERLERKSDHIERTVK